jgi:hypothetical protein
MQEAIEVLLKNAQPGDAIMTIGAGSVGKVSDELAVLLGAHEPVPPDEDQQPLAHPAGTRGEDRNAN